MSRYGQMFGPDITFLGVERCDLDDPAGYAGADVVILGAPFDGGTSHRPGARFGPNAIRQTCYLPHDGSRPSLALRVDALKDLRVLDAGDVETYAGDIEGSLRAIEDAVARIAASGAVPVVLGGDHTIALPDATGVARHHGFGRVSMIHFDAHADTGDIEFGHLHGHGQPMRRLIESGAIRGDRFLQIGLRGYWPGPEILDWMAGQRMRSYEMTEIVARGSTSASPRRTPSRWTTATGSTCRSTWTSATRATRRAPAPPSRAVCRPASFSTPSGGPVTSCPSSGWRSSRLLRRTTTRTSRPISATGSSWRRCRRSPGAAGTPPRAPAGTPGVPSSTDADPFGPVITVRTVW